MEINQFDIQSFVNVLTILDKMPMSDSIYRVHNGGINGAKKAIHMDFYGRTVIDWKLECEDQKGLDRKSIMDLMNFSVG
jgi:hypothetical protein